MKGYLTSCAVPAVLVAALLLPAAVLAQTNPAAPPADADTAPQKSPAASAPSPRDKMLQMVDRRIADLHAKLHITAAEEPQWGGFADVMRANARRMDDKVAERAGRFRTLNAVDNMRSYAGITQVHAENMQKLVPAFAGLYDSLSEQQKHTADEVWRSYAQSQQTKK
jgi:periplasmic protein CpxP/Spy